MVNYEEKVFHPNLGICDVTGIDKKGKTYGYYGSGWKYLFHTIQKPAPGRCEKSDGKQRG